MTPDPHHEVKRKISELRTTEELDGFAWGLQVLGHLTLANQNLIEMRRAELRGLKRP